MTEARLREIEINSNREDIPDLVRYIRYLWSINEKDTGIPPNENNT
jgi:hypothetical protein